MSMSVSRRERGTMHIATRFWEEEEEASLPFLLLQTARRLKRAVFIAP